MIAWSMRLNFIKKFVDQVKWYHYVKIFYTIATCFSCFFFSLRFYIYTNINYYIRSSSCYLCIIWFFCLLISLWIFLWWVFCDFINNFITNQNTSCFCCFLNYFFWNGFKCICSRSFCMIKKFLAAFIPYILTFYLYLYFCSYF